MATNLNLSTLDTLSPGVKRPTYKRTDLKPGILHIGVGNFHRAHQAHYLDALFNAGLDHDWAIVGAGFKSFDQTVRNELEQQDWLTTVVELDPTGLSARVTGSMIDYVNIDPVALIAAMARPEIRIVSLTITEGGYFVDSKTGGFDANHPEIVHDIENQNAPQTVFGCLIAALIKRRDAGIAPFTIMSCDNLPENGHVARATTCGLACAMSKEVGDWVSTNVAFPNGMVDCITPATSDRERSMVREKFDIVDARPVACEPFRQWVLEDNFPQGRPALEKVGVEFVSDVAPYELMKLRILNGGHAAIAYPAGLLGIHFVHDAMAHPLIRGFMRKLAQDEIIPTVPFIEGVDFQAYLDKVTERFSNPVIGDTIPRLCLDGSNRQPKFILPALRDRLAAGLPVDGLALEVALWCHYCAGSTEAGAPIEVVDERSAILREKSLATTRENPAFLDHEAVFGSLNKEEPFRAAFLMALHSLRTQGVEKTLQHYVSG